MLETIERMGYDDVTIMKQTNDTRLGAKINIDVLRRDYEKDIVLLITQ